ncbi:hypothetical protein HYQ46_000706 [Verticillium longisporum]|nr:hypothetical protein HYQ46_000706 [Verticillium longisporum]
MTTSVKFALPSGAQYFTPFAVFPVEIRLQIWEAAIFEPGMHFLKIVPNDDQGHVLARVIQGSRRFLLVRAHLAPIFPNPKADNSHYVALAKVLDTLSNTCSEAKRVVQRLLRDPRTLEVNGQPIALTSHAQDIVCLDYLPSDLFYTVELISRSLATRMTGSSSRAYLRLSTGSKRTFADTLSRAPPLATGTVDPSRSSSRSSLANGTLCRRQRLRDRRLSRREKETTSACLPAMQRSPPANQPDRPGTST